MSTPPDQLQVQASVGSGAQQNPPVPYQSDSMDQSMLQDIGQYRQQLSKMQQLSEAQAGDIQNTEEQIQNSPIPHNSGSLGTMPFLLALTAFGGAITGLHGRVMLGALSGMAQGAAQGNEQAFNDNLKLYQQKQKKLAEIVALKNQYYSTLLESYGRTAEGQLQAMMMTDKIVGDEQKNAVENEKLGIDYMNSRTMAHRAAEAVAHDRSMERFAGMRAAAAVQTANQNAQKMNPLTPLAAKQQAIMYIQTGQINGGFSYEIRQQVMNEVAQLTQQAGISPSELGTRSAAYKASEFALRTNSRMLAGIQSYEQTAEKQFDIVRQASHEAWRGAVPLINEAILKGRTSVLGSSDSARLANAVLTASNEYARIMSGGTASVAQVSDSARIEAQAMMSAAMTPGQLDSVIKQERVSMLNRLQSVTDEQNGLLNYIQGLGILHPRADLQETPKNIPAPGTSTNYDSPQAVKQAWLAGQFGDPRSPQAKEAAAAALRKQWPDQFSAPGGM